MQVALVVLVAACVYLPFLGVRPLDFSEGHRAVPGWTMLESYDFWHQKMFGLTYIRKPPGMAWAIAASSAWLGQTPFAARLPSAISAILMSVIAWWYGRRWFGGPGARLAGVSAGLGQALLPLMWSPGRTAEIEMLNNLGTQMFALGMVDLLMGKAVRREGATQEKSEESGPMAFLWEVYASSRDVLLPAAGLFIAAFAKGPASGPVLGGVLIGAWVAVRSPRPLASRGVWIALLFGVGAIVLLGMKFLIANNQPDAVREDVAGQFLWSGRRVVGVLTLLPLAWASAMPASLALLVPFMRNPRGHGGARRSNGSSQDVGREVPPRDRGGSECEEGGPIARVLAWAWLIAVLILVCTGVSNARYAMPAAVLLPALLPYAINVLRPRLGALAAKGEGVVGMVRRWVLPPMGWAGAMVMGAWWFVILTGIVATEDQKAGVAAAALMGGIASDSELWADDAIEARPDVLWLVGRESAQLKIRWAKAPLLAGELPPIGGYLLLRTDHESAEGVRYSEHVRDGRLFQLSKAMVRRYEFTLYQVRVAPPSAGH